MQDSGRLVEPKGTYEGTFLNGKKHGSGTYVSKNGSKYKGEYINDYRSGQGVLYNKDNTVAYEGEMWEGLPHGKGKVTQNGKKVEVKLVEGIKESQLKGE